MGILLFVFRAFSIFLIVFHAALLAEEKQHLNTNEPQRATQTPSPSLVTQAYMNGLLAAPGSPQRLDAAKILKSQIESAQEKFYAKNPLAKRFPEMQKGLDYAVEYLATPKEKLTPDGKVCPPEERIRVYRGYSGQPIIGPKGHAGPGFVAMKGWGRELVSAIKGLKKNNALQVNGMKQDTTKVPGEAGWVTGDSTGKVIYENLSLLDANNKQTRNALFEKTDWDATTTKYNWIQKAIDHTAGQEFTTGEDLSRDSFFISTTLDFEVSKNFGEGGILVAEVCPERFFLTQNPQELKEKELLLPFFILPEEIVAVLHHDCTFYLDPLAVVRCEEDHNAEYPEDLDPKCQKIQSGINYCQEQRKKLRPSISGEASPKTNLFQQIYTDPIPVPKAFLEVKGSEYFVGSLNMQRFPFIKNAYNNIWNSSANAQELRTKLLDLKKTTQLRPEILEKQKQKIQKTITEIEKSINESKVEKAKYESAGKPEKAQAEESSIQKNAIKLNAYQIFEKSLKELIPTLTDQNL